MNVLRLIIVLVVFLLLLTGCTQKFHLSPVVEGNNPEVILHRGKEIAISDENETSLLISGSRISSDELILRVLYFNKTDSKFININPEMVSVVGYDQYGVAKTFKVYSADEYLKKIRRKQIWTAVLMGLSGALNAYNASYSTATTYSTTSGTIYGSKGDYYKASTTTSTTTDFYDHRGLAEANDRNQKNLENLTKQQSDTYQALECGLIKANTLLPKGYAQGNIIVKIDGFYTKKFVVTVPFEEELHVITFVPKPF